MKFIPEIAKLVSGKAKVLSTLGGLAIAGAVMTVAAPAAKAQVAFGVEVGTPRYYAPAPQPVYAGRGYVGVPYGEAYGRRDGYWQDRRTADWRAHEWREREQFDRQREFDRDHHFDGRGWR